jgi:hypothetical protein
MKMILGFIVLIVSANALQCQPQATITRIELSKIARGYEEYVRITQDSVNVLVSNSLDPTANKNYGRKLASSDWTEILDALSGVKLADVPSLPSPTMNRATDAAKHSTITIETNDGKSYAHGYDDENPNDALKKVLKRIRDLSGEKN